MRQYGGSKCSPIFTKMMLSTILSVLGIVLIFYGVTHILPLTTFDRRSGNISVKAVIIANREFGDRLSDRAFPELRGNSGNDGAILV
jgi:hypothetical protein